MILVLISALLPIIVTLCLGYFSGARKDFGESHSKILNKLIMSYSLPMSLFGGILATGRKVIFENIPVAIWNFIGMVGGYLIVFSICKFILRKQYLFVGFKITNYIRSGNSFCRSDFVRFFISDRNFFDSSHRKLNYECCSSSLNGYSFVDR